MLPLTALHNLLGYIDSANQLVVANHDVMPLWKKHPIFSLGEGKNISKPMLNVVDPLVK